MKIEKDYWHNKEAFFLTLKPWIVELNMLEMFQTVGYSSGHIHVKRPRDVNLILSGSKAMNVFKENMWCIVFQFKFRKGDRVNYQMGKTISTDVSF